jgi:predicted homoserine dehydrogenase-like protein
MNSEVDLVAGPYLLQLARRHDAVYTSCDGDQHGVIKHIVDDIRLWGFDLVMAGNIKGFLDRYANPATIVPEADKRHLGYKMATAYTDGTKLGIEMALLANALGLAVMMPGMTGPRASHVHEVFRLFDFASIRDRARPVVDYILGAEPDGGVFVVGHCANAYQARMLSYYKMGDGPFYLFYRPYHLCHIEAMACIAAACLDGTSLLQPDRGLHTNVYAYAKRALRRGERLDGIGGFTCYGQIEENAPGRPTGLPISLAADVTLERDIHQDGKIHLDDVRYDAGRLDFDLYFKALGLRTDA